MYGRGTGCAATAGGALVVDGAPLADGSPATGDGAAGVDADDDESGAGAGCCGGAWSIVSALHTPATAGLRKSCRFAQRSHSANPQYFNSAKLCGFPSPPGSPVDPQADTPPSSTAAVSAASTPRALTLNPP
ncbi:hypothetical protein CG736_32800 [Kitasatospora sp. CB02891]|nr:hypothetical protein CG736_32800 [Kitasatospora sp. CB02891]